MSRQSATRAVDAIIGELAARQHGVVERARLLAAGVTLAEIEGRVRRGTLIVLHRGVYAVGHAVLRPAGYRLAAAMACGPEAAVSWVAAGAHWQLRRSAAARVDVTVASGSGRTRPGIRVHRDAIEPWERTMHDAVPVTTPARTLLDLGEVLTRRGLERALDEADGLRLLDVAAIGRVLDAHPHRYGAARLRALLGDVSIGDALTRSELEERVLALCERRGLPRPAVNARVAGLEVD